MSYFRNYKQISKNNQTKIQCTFILLPEITYDVDDPNTPSTRNVNTDTKKKHIIVKSIHFHSSQNLKIMLNLVSRHR